MVNCSVHIKADVAGGTQRKGSTRKMLVIINKTLPTINVRLRYLRYCLIIAMGFIYQTQWLIVEERSGLAHKKASFVIDVKTVNFSKHSLIS